MPKTCPIDTFIGQKMPAFALSIKSRLPLAAKEKGWLLRYYFAVMPLALNRAANLKGIEPEQLIARASVRAVACRHERAKTRERNRRLDRCVTQAALHTKNCRARLACRLEFLCNHRKLTSAASIRARGKGRRACSCFGKQRRPRSSQQIQQISRDANERTNARQTAFAPPRRG